jgi:hypothetical protein
MEAYRRRAVRYRGDQSWFVGEFLRAKSAAAVAASAGRHAFVESAATGRAYASTMGLEAGINVDGPW